MGEGGEGALVGEAYLCSVDGCASAMGLLLQFSKSVVQCGTVWYSVVSSEFLLWT